MTERLARRGILAGLFALLLLFTTALLLILSYRANMQELKARLAEHCDERRVHYLAENRLREVQILAWNDLAAASEDPEEIAAYRAMQGAVEQAITTSPSQPCSEYLAQR